MKKKLLLLLCVLALSCAALLSCLVAPGGGGGNTEEEGGLVTIIRPADADYGFDYLALKNAYFASAGVMLDVYDDESRGEGKGELIIGDADRALTATAKNALLSWLVGDEVGFILYSDGSSLALWWSDDFMKQNAYDYLLDNVIEKGITTFEAGTVKSAKVSKSEAKKAEEELIRDADFAEAATLIGQEAADALRAHYDIYGKEVYLWIGSLYDPGTGGFYFSDSALANEGYLPDVESTAQALGLLANIGIFQKYDNSYYKGLPAEMVAQITTFVQGLQSPDDGYFYHPQWGTSISTSRLSRDLNFATSLLTALRAKPKWNAPDGTKGQYGAPPNATAFTLPLSGASVTAAVAAAVDSAEINVYPARLQTLENWKSYIVCDLNGNSAPDDLTPNKIRIDSYSIGNELTAQAKQVLQRDALALSLGELEDGDKDGFADGGYVETLIEILNGWQLEYNGLWEENLSAGENGTVADPEGAPYYDSINGLMKISSIYNDLGVEFPNAGAALDQAVYMINYFNAASDGRPGADLKGKRPENVVDVYNPWIAVHQLFTNLSACGDASTTATLRAELVANAPAMIRTTTAKTLLFKRDDGSFGYNWDGNVYKSQGANVAVPGMKEGDVNGCTLAVSGVSRNICYALGLKNIPMFYDSDRDALIDLLSSLSPVVKAPIGEIEIDPVDFEDYEVGDRNGAIDALTTGLGTGYIEITEAPGAGGAEQGKVLQLKTLSKAGNDALYFGVSGAGQSSFVLEFDVYFEDYGSDMLLLQATLGGAYRITFTAKDGYIYLGDSNNISSSPINNDLGIAFAAREWHKVRIEYYPDDAASVATKIYLDGKLRAVSDNYIGRDDSLATPATPKTSYTQATFNSLKEAVQTVYLDNVLAVRDSATYEEETVETPYLVKDFESSDSLFAADIGGASISADPAGGENKVLSFDEYTVALLPTSVTNPNYNCFSLGMKLYVPEGADGEVARIYFDNGDMSYAVAAWSVVAYTDGGSQYFAIYELTFAGRGDEPLADGFFTDEWVELRFEYYRRQYDADYTYCRSILYEIDGDEATVIARGRSFFDINNMKRDFSSLRIANPAGRAFSVDDLVPEKLYKAYIDESGAVVPDTDVPFASAGASSDTPAQNNHNGTFDFEGVADGVPSIPGLATSPNKDQYGNSIEVARDPENGTNGALKVSTAAGNAGNTVKFAWSKVDTAGSLYAVQYSLYVEDCESGAVLQASVRGAGGGNESTIFAFGATVSDNGDGTYRFLITEKPESGAQNTILTVDSVSGWITFKLVYDSESGTAGISVGDTEGQTAACWNDSNVSLAPEYFYIFATSKTVIDYYVDNVYLKSVNES